VATTIERDTTGGLHSSVDDYVVNLTVADRLVAGEGAATAGETDTTANASTAQTADHTDTTHDTYE
jgi:hypothetical protein